MCSPVKKRGKMRLPVITVMLLALPLAAVAGGLPFSHYGLLDTPSAALLRHSEVALCGSGTVFSVEDSAGTSKTNIGTAAYLEVGLFGRGQIGGTYLGSAGFSGTARGLILFETINRPGIAVGIENITGEKNYEFYRDSNDSLYSYSKAQNFSIYGVITKDFSYFLPFPMCLNLGFGTGRFSQSSEATDVMVNPVPGLFGSLLLHPNISSEVMVEWDGRDLNAGGFYRLGRNFTVIAAASELEHLFLSSDSTADPTDVMQHAKFTLGLRVNLGPFFDRTELDPYQRLRYTEDDEALILLREYRAKAREEIQELEDSII
jgi:hypothetical protein